MTSLTIEKLVFCPKAQADVNVDQVCEDCQYQQGITSYDVECSYDENDQADTS